MVININNIDLNKSKDSLNEMVYNLLNNKPSIRIVEDKTNDGCKEFNITEIYGSNKNK